MGRKKRIQSVFLSTGDHRKSIPHGEGSGDDDNNHYHHHYIDQNQKICQMISLPRQITINKEREKIEKYL